MKNIFVESKLFWKGGGPLMPVAQAIEDLFFVAL